MRVDLERRAEAWEVRWEVGRANALSADLVEELHDVVGSAVRDQAPALVLAGGQQHFAAGFDLSGLADESDASLAHRFLRIGLLLDRLARAPFLTVAAVRGPAIGAGADLMAACDRRLALQSATFAFPGPRFGVVLGTERLGALLRGDRALALLGPQVKAAESGLVEVHIDAAQLDAAVGGLLADWSCTDPAARPGLLAAVRSTSPDRALAALARSVLRPGLRGRLIAYADSVGFPTSPPVASHQEDA